MYEGYYGLKEAPFELTPDPRYLFLTPRHREALSNLEYGISARKGLTLLIGEAGTGKTTLLRTLLGQMPQVTCIYLNNPALTRWEFVEFLARVFELGSRAARSKATLLAELDRLLRERFDRHQLTVLAIDEAQSLPIALLEEIRLLSNIETDTDKLLPLVLTGQPELAQHLNDPSLRQLKQRVTLRCDLGPFDFRETAAYIAGRICIAGGHGGDLFTPGAVRLVHERSKGIPRTISVICDNALLNGFATDRRPVDEQIIGEVCEDFDLRGGEPADPIVRPTPADERVPLNGNGPERSFGSDPEADPSARLFFTVGRRRFSFF
jgi:type II secretory pathway predicted ATPase ExeA